MTGLLTVLTLTTFYGGLLFIPLRKRLIYTRGDAEVLTDGDRITVTFTQDNAGEQHMTAQLEITHMPTYTAWRTYNRDWGEEHE